MISCGFIYVSAPINWIPNWVPILGKLDDLAFGWVPLFLGVYFCFEADKKFPLPRDPQALAPLAIGMVTLLLCALSEKIRGTLLGVAGIILTPFISIQLLDELNLAVGVTLFVWGFIYLQLPYDLIPDSCPCIGKLDDMIFGWGFMLAGAAVMVVHNPAILKDALEKGTMLFEGAKQAFHHYANTKKEL